MEKGLRIREESENVNNEKEYETIQELTARLRQEQTLPDAAFRALLQMESEQALECLYGNARQVQEAHYGKKVYARGLIEFTNYCRNNCYYCGIRCENRKAERYRLSENAIYSCAAEGYALGFRTFVLQGGEDIFLQKKSLAVLFYILKNYILIVL